jgi:hypothetical protein
LPVKVDPGEHVVQAALEGYDPYSSSVPVPAGGKTYLVAALKPSPPAVTSFAASHASITSGQNSTLSWTTQNAGEVRIDPGIGTVSPQGTKDVSPVKTTTYVLTAKGSGGSTSAKTSVAVEVDPTDLQAINETMARFKGAYDSMDIRALQREWPSLTQTQSDAMKTTFLGLASIRLTDDCPGTPAINGDSAQWRCTETISYVNRGGEKIPDARNTVVFHFKQVDGKWYVDRREGAR